MAAAVKAVPATVQSEYSVERREAIRWRLLCHVAQDVVPMILDYLPRVFPSVLNYKTLSHQTGTLISANFQHSDKGGMQVVAAFGDESATRAITVDNLDEDVRRVDIPYKGSAVLNGRSQIVTDNAGTVCVYSSKTRTSVYTAFNGDQVRWSHTLDTGSPDYLLTYEPATNQMFLRVDSSFYVDGKSDSQLEEFSSVYGLVTALDREALLLVDDGIRKFKIGKPITEYAKMTVDLATLNPSRTRLFVADDKNVVSIYSLPDVVEQPIKIEGPKFNTFAANNSQLATLTINRTALGCTLWDVDCGTRILDFEPDSSNLPRNVFRLLSLGELKCALSENALAVLAMNLLHVAVVNIYDLRVPKTLKPSITYS